MTARVVAVAAVLAVCSVAAAITPQPTPTRTRTPTPTPTPEPPTVVCSVTVPADGRAHSVAARVYYLHEEAPCVLYHRSVEQLVGAGAVVDVEAEGSPVGADVWIDSHHVRTCGQGDPVYLDGLESGNSGRWTPCATPTPPARRPPVADTTGVPLLPDGGQGMAVPTPADSGARRVPGLWQEIRSTVGRWL